MASSRPDSRQPRPKVSGRVAGIAVLACFVAGCVPGVPVPLSPGGGVVTSQLEGADRVAVAISASTQLSARGAVPVVYLVAANPDSEAAAAAPAAALEGGAILHAGATALAPAVATELARLAPDRVEIVGGTSTIGKAVVGQVSSLLGEGASVERIAGRTAPETAALLSAGLFAPSAPIAFVASADAYFDALVAASAAANVKAPLLLVTRDTLPSSTAAELRRLSPDRLIVVGGKSAVSEAVLAGLRTVVPVVEQISGSDRYSTAAAVATKLFAGAESVLATAGTADLGALAAIPLVAGVAPDGTPLLLTQPGEQLPVATRDALMALEPAFICIAGPLPPLIRGELIGYSDGRLGLPVETATYPALDSGWHEPGELYTVIKATEIAYPSLVSVFSIGKSAEGRDIWAAKISDNVSIDEDEPEVLVDALHHAAEHLGVEQALYLLNTLTSGYATDKEIRRLVDSREIWIIFAVNPDGWVYDISGGEYHWWRKSRQHNFNNPNLGVDLNRNYSYMWGCCGGSDSRVWAWNYRGPEPFSAPETRAVANFVAGRVVNGEQQIKTHVTLHSHGEMVLYPMSYTLQRLPSDMDPTDYSVFQAMARKMAATNGYKAQQSSQQYPTDGDEIDWMYATYRIFSFTFELYPTEEQAGKGIVYPSDDVIARQTARNRSALLYLIDAAACPYAAIGKAAQYCAAVAASPSG